MRLPTRAETIAWLAADVELMAADQASGLVPEGVTRPLHPHEVHTDFAGMKRDVDATSARIAADMQADREAFIALLAADVAAVAAHPGTVPADVAVAARLLQLQTSLGVPAVAGATALIAAATARYRAALQAAAERGADRTVAEARRQHAEPGRDPTLDQLGSDRLDLAARRLAEAPHAAVLAAAAAESYQLPGLAASELRPVVVSGLRALSPAVLETTLARPAVHQAEGLGRQAAMGVLPAAVYYASELLDGATCAPCDHVDGTKYRTLAAGVRDYPAGGYRGCMGGDRCRGTLVAVWGREQAHG